MSTTPVTHERLADKILKAFEMALDQKDVAISDLLGKALEMSLTRNSGGKKFVERRDLADEVQAALEKWDELRSQK